MEKTQDAEYLEIILRRLRVCREYKPAFGRRERITLARFRELYGADPFYSWFGMDDPLVYAAHRAAGGMTSVYRQIGLGCEELFRRILQDCLGLDASQVTWAYQTTTPSGRKRTLSLDARITLSEIRNGEKRDRFAHWLVQAAAHVQVTPEIIGVLKGVVFEVRQGYKSKDAKRQNADIANAAVAYAQGYLPVLLLLSTQIDNDVADRYRQAQWLILSGNIGGSPLQATYVFTRDVVGYDLAGFFQRNTPLLRDTVRAILHTLLTVRESGDG